METTHDVIIVGAGPAGAVLAYLLARRGVAVLVLEKANLPRYKTCGGGVTFKTLHWLPFDTSPVFECQIVGGILSFAGQPMRKVNIGWTVAWTVMRSHFDCYLIQHAVQAGARLQEGAHVNGITLFEDRVEAHTGQGDYAARFLVGADGVSSIVARSLGMLPKRRTGIALEAEVEVPVEGLSSQGVYATFDFGALPYGYGWIFPKQDHLSVGEFQALPGKALGLRQRLLAFIACQPALKGGRIIHLQGHPIPLGVTRQPLHHGRVLLVGDAANLADPWLGEGICYAIQSAALAAPVISAALGRSGRDLGQYTRQVHAQILPQQRAAAGFAKLVYSFPRACSKLISCSQILQQVVLSALRGDLTYRQLGTSVFRSLPVILWEAFTSIVARDQNVSR